MRGPGDDVTVRGSELVYVLCLGVVQRDVTRHLAGSHNEPFCVILFRRVRCFKVNAVVMRGVMEVSSVERGNGVKGI